MKTPACRPNFESFTSYHRALYKQVEATGATPFAPRALDRGLHGLLVALARHTTAGAAADKSAQVPVDSDVLGDVARVIVDRAMAVAGAGTAGAVEEALDELAEAWEDERPIQYANWKGLTTINALMVPAGSARTGDDGETLAESFPPVDAPWATLTSLRNVDRESTLRIITAKKAKAGTDYGGN